MGKKKPTPREEENPSAMQGGGGKSKKKAVVIDDDEYSVGTVLSEENSVQEEQIAPTGGKKKDRKGSSKSLQAKDDDGDENNAEGDDDDDVAVIKFGGKKKSKSKKGGNSNVFSGSGFGLLEEEGNDEDEVSSVTQDKDDEGGLSEEESESLVAFTGKKKPSKSKKSTTLFTASAVGVAGDDLEIEQKSDNDDDDEPVTAFTGKKKPSKSKKKSSGGIAASSFDGLDEGEETKDEVNGEDDDFSSITFSGKKKSSKSSKKNTNSFNAVFSGDNDDIASVSKLVDDSVRDDVGAPDDDESLVMFSGKKKSSKKKNNSAFEVGPRDELADVAELEQPGLSIRTREADDAKTKKEDVTEASKNKKKKKKGGRTAQEEDDLDKILAELGERTATSKPTVAPPQEEIVQVQPEPAGLGDDTGEKEAEEEGGVESAAAKKKKKKKDKEKEKKAAAAAAVAPAVEEKKEDTKNEAKSKLADKKVPKHVREMQERLARLKEAEERKKREEEEKLREEEEERRQQEEIERLAEEKKRLRKEREKEKMLKKKQEGKLLTGKQKEEARRREAMRNQILANATVLSLSTGDTAAPGKRPKYQTKKSKPHLQANGSAVTKAVESVESEENQQETLSELDSLEADKAEEVESVSAEEKTEAVDVVDANGIEEEDDEDEWDAKSWDDADLKLPGKSAFADEEADSDPEPVVKKEIKSARPATRDTKPAVPTQKVIPTTAVKSEEVGNKETQHVGELKENIKQKVMVKKEAPKAEGTEDDLRSPICCIMGHVDTGKTKLLDCIRGTNVQEGEAGGITQQIGATYFPAENIRERTKELKADAKLKVPGLLVIDTPGHESFSNLRSRGSGLCDIAILVVDIMHGLEPQTIESLNLLKMRNTEFIVALNKVDRLYGWKTCRNAPIVKAMKQQSKDVQLEFNNRLTQVITQFKEQGLNTELYYKNKEMGETFSIVPTTAISGEGIPDLLLLLVQWTQKTMVEKLTYSHEVQCTVLEVKVVEGHGTTIDVVLVNGTLHEGDQIVGPIVTSIRALLTPHPMKELRVKGTYLHHKEIKAAQGIKITAQGLEHAIAGTGLYVVGADDDLEDVKESAMEDMRSVMSRIDKSGEGVCVQASTLGSLEALLEFLKTPAVNIPVSGISIGPVHKKDVMKASVMLEKKKEYATILAFDVKVTTEAQMLADEAGVRIFIADIIYHLFDQFKAYIDNLKEEKKKEAAEDAVFPCILKIMPDCVFNKKDPIVLGVDVLEGIAKVGTPICIPQKEFIGIGRIASIENNHKPVDYAKKGQKVAIKIIGSNPDEQQKMFGRHFEIEDELVSHISRRSIDILKANYREDLTNEEWRLVVKLKNLFKIN
ncbi:hypothetical protein RJ640_031018 [Escallonia rubra]|uniref:Eukaryotic translation initiation factor 5B n=1 Tax=Escallonia rubra TaxID=112253 RepID=A0AA88UAL0_9ASTE|nr:hypothetical protein RJ640_031018 [Escallonia rubra]